MRCHLWMACGLLVYAKQKAEDVTATAAATKLLANSAGSEPRLHLRALGAVSVRRSAGSELRPSSTSP